jgi:hypothetical protein
MNIDKIKYHLSPIIFEFWTSLHKSIPQKQCIDKISEAYTELKNETEKGIRKNSISTQSEIQLLKHLSQKR